MDPQHINTIIVEGPDSSNETEHCDHGSDKQRLLDLYDEYLKNPKAFADSDIDSVDEDEDITFSFMDKKIRRKSSRRSTLGYNSTMERISLTMNLEEDMDLIEPVNCPVKDDEFIEYLESLKSVKELHQVALDLIKTVRKQEDEYPKKIADNLREYFQKEMETFKERLDFLKTNEPQVEINLCSEDKKIEKFTKQLTELFGNIEIKKIQVNKSIRNIEILKNEIL